MRSIWFKADKHVDFTPPPPPPTKQELEARALAAVLLGAKAVHDYAIRYLQEYGVDIHPHRPGARLRRLRELKKRGRRFNSLASLADAIAQLYWI